MCSVSIFCWCARSAIVRATLMILKYSRIESERFSCADWSIDLECSFSLQNCLISSEPRCALSVLF